MDYTHIHTSGITDPSPTPRFDDTKCEIRKRAIPNHLVHISRKMCDFLSKPQNTILSRCEVELLLKKYITKHMLLNGKVVIPNTSLQNLLNIKTDFPLFQLSILIAEHCIAI